MDKITSSEISPRLIRILNTVLESDLTYTQGYNASNIIKIKKLLSVIASSTPFTPNISKIATKLSLGRTTIMQYMKHLHDAHILRLINKSSKGISALQKPDKIYFENTNMAYALQPNAEVGTIRETFFVNQMSNAGHELFLASKGDFETKTKEIFEIGGKGKTSKQLQGVSNAYLVKDDIEHGFGQTIPLWLFGLLY